MLVGSQPKEVGVSSPNPIEVYHLFRLILDYLDRNLLSIEYYVIDDISC